MQYSVADPSNPIEAVTHADPYPYYAALVERAPLYRDEALNCWVATSAQAVEAVLTNKCSRVRPPNEPIPKNLLGSPAADIFGRLIRMNDGAGHCPFNRAVRATLASIEPAEVLTRAHKWADRLLENTAPTSDAERLNAFMFALSAHVIGELLDVPLTSLSSVNQWVGDFVRCVFPSSSAEQIERGKLASSRLFDLFGKVFASASQEKRTLLSALAAEARRVGCADTNVIVANGIGFLSQAYEATAGLIANALLTLARREELRAAIGREPQLIRNLLHEVLRFDPPTHNTRRFLSEDTEILGRTMRRDESILVVLAAANRDPKANPDPHRFDLHRANRQLFTFGVGAHACPGDRFALAIAEAGVAAVLKRDVALESLADRFQYRASANTRIPLFAS